MDIEVQSTRSRHREALLEHLFSGEVMKRLWRHGEWRLEVLKPQVDDGGYNLVLEANQVVRHVQLKSSFRGSTIRDTTVNTLLAQKPSGCVVFVWFEPESLDLGPFAFFGSAPGKQLPDLSQMKQARHTRANALGKKAERPSTKIVPLSAFQRVTTVEEIVAKLFGS